MGVPSFYAWVRSVCSKYERLLPAMTRNTDLAAPNEIGEVDNFYIDINGVIHNCSHPEMGPAPTSEQEILERIMEVLDLYMNYIRPRKLLFIAVDGVCPVAKIVQQRKRRYCSARDARDDAWDSNCITPGTPFMDVLSVALQGYIVDRMNTSAYWSGINVVLSDASCPGEGEYKIFDFLRSQSEDVAFAELRHCVYGMDADLIMLSLASLLPHLTIFREEMTFPKRCKVCGGKHATKDHDNPPRHARLLMCNPNELRVWLLDRAREQCGDAFDEMLVVFDFVFITFLVGNDFLPKIPSIKVQNRGMDTLLQYYWPLVREGKYLTDGFVVQFQHVRELFIAIAHDEEALLRNLSKQKKVRNYDKELYYDSSTEIRVGEVGYHERFYTTHFGKDAVSPAFIAQMVHDYYEGMVWVFQYYTQGVPSWRWFYKYHFAPFAQDFLAHMREPYAITFDVSEPVTPLEQLLSVLPPRSFSNIPAVFREMVLDPQSPVQSYYSTSFKTDINGENQLYKGVPDLDFVDNDRLHAFVAEKQRALDGRERRRNRLWGEHILYVACSSLQQYVVSVQQAMLENAETIRAERDRYETDPTHRIDLSVVPSVQIDVPTHHLTGRLVPVIDLEQFVSMNLAYLHFENGKLNKKCNLHVFNFYLRYN